MNRHQSFAASTNDGWRLPLSSRCPGRRGGKGDENRKLRRVAAGMAGEKMITVGDVERAVAQAVVGASSNAMTPDLPVASKAVLSAASTASNPELQKMVRAAERADLDFPTRPAFKVRCRLSSRANCALKCVRMDIAHRVEEPSHLLLSRRAPRADCAWPGGGDPKSRGQIEIFFCHPHPTHAHRAPAPKQSARSRPDRGA